MEGGMSTYVAQIQLDEGGKEGGREEGCIYSFPHLFCCPCPLLQQEVDWTEEGEEGALAELKKRRFVTGGWGEGEEGGDGKEGMYVEREGGRAGGSV